jgi:hypothetical protein
MAWKYERSSELMSRNGLPASLSLPAVMVRMSTPAHLRRPETLGNSEMTPMLPVRVPGLAKTFSPPMAM